MERSFGVDSHDPSLSLLARVDAWRREDPDALVVVDYDIRRSKLEGVLTRRRALSVGELWKETVALAASLQREGIGRDDIVALHLPNWHEFLVIHLALYALGAVTMPISPIFRKLDVTRQLVLARVAGLVSPGTFGDFDYVGMAADLRDELPSLRTLIAVGRTPESVDHGQLHWADLVHQGRRPDLAEERERIASGEFARPTNELMLLNFTSGTTGEPKGVMHSTVSVMSGVAALTDRLRLHMGEILSVPSTLGHAGGYLNGLYIPLYLRGKAVYLDVWDPTFALEIVEKEQVSYGPIMPPHLADLVEHPRLACTDISSWTTARVSGNAIPRMLMQSFQDKLPTVRLCPGWGTTEILYATCAGPEDPVDKRIWTDGRTLTGFELEARDPSFERALPLGEPGEIVARCPSQMLGYFGRQELSASSFTADGWFKTGDIGRFDAEGHLTLVGRSKDIVVRGGENVPVVEVEHLLMNHPDIVSVAVIGLPDLRLGEKVCAVIECRLGCPPVTLDDMRTYLIDRGLTKQFIPEVLMAVELLPKTSVGKIRKAQLRDEIVAALSACTTARKEDAIAPAHVSPDLTSGEL